MRRTTLLLALLTALAAGWSCTQPPEKTEEKDVAEAVMAPASFVRHNAQTPEGEAQLTAMATALDKMRQTPCNNPLSWYYQGAIHWVPDSVANKNPLCPQYITRADTLKAWDNCTHTGTSNSNFQFLIWHRLYIWHFEKIVRAQSGKADFALPYWKYVDPAYRTLPAELRNTGSALYAKERLDSLNLGDPINGTFSAVFLTGATRAAMQADTYDVFNSNIDAAPHGAMHNYIGGGTSHTPMFNSIYQSTKDPGSGRLLYGLMTQVASAGFDPVFWLHHSNIDFLWNEWENSPKGERPSLQEVQKYPWHFVFPEPDGTFKTYTMREAYLAAFNPDYTYSDARPMIAMNSQKHNELTKDAELMVPQDSLIASEAVKKKLGSGVTSLPLRGRLQEPLLKANDLGTFKGANRDKGNLVLKLTVSFDIEPTGGYSVYLDSDADTRNGEGELLGVLTFFGAAHHATMHKDHAGPITKTFLFDATDEVESGGRTPHLIFKKAGGNNAEVTVESIEIYQY